MAGNLSINPLKQKAMSTIKRCREAELDAYCKKHPVEVFVIKFIGVIIVPVIVALLYIFRDKTPIPW
jgi:hypothetical protein